MCEEKQHYRSVNHLPHTDPIGSVDDMLRQCDFRSDLFFSLSFANYFLVLVSL